MKNEGILRLGAELDSADFPTLAAAPTTDDICTAMREGRWRGTVNVKGALEVLFKMKHVEQFNFGPLSLDTIREAQKEALDFIEYGCFTLPFDECIYRCSVAFDNRTVGFHLFCVRRNGDAKSEICTVGTIHSHDHTLSFRSDNMLNVRQHPTLGRALEIIVPTVEIKHWEPYIGKVSAGEKINENGEIITEGSLVAMGLTMILNTKGVLKERSSPPRKPNLARAKQGRPLLPYVTKVYTAVYNRAVEKGPQGTHASPRPHRRRAHVRHYPARDGRPAYMLPIAAMLVNWDGQPLVERKYYEEK